MKLTSAGAVRKYIGIDIQRDRSKRLLTLEQSRYSNDYISKEVPKNANPKLIPLPSTIDYNEPNKSSQNRPIDHEIGKIRYLADHTRPDMLAGAGILGSHVSNPSDTHVKGLLHFNKYIKGTPHLGLTYSGSPNKEDYEINLLGFADAAYLRFYDSKSRLAYCFFLNLNSGTVCARSVKDTTISHSSTEAEIKALDLAIKQVIWLRGFLKEIGFEQKKPTVIYMDNAAAKYLAESLDNCSNNFSHIIVKLNFIQQEVLSGTIEVKYINTDYQIADILTKPLANEKFSQLRKILLEGFKNSPIDEVHLKKRPRQR
jgi:hypothetical protein